MRVKVQSFEDFRRVESLESRIFLSTYAFADEFNGTAGSGPSSAWGAGNATDPNNASVIYTNTTPAQSSGSKPVTLQIVSDPAANDGKALALSLTPDPTKSGSYDSAEITTEFDPSGAGDSLEYGHIEARIRAPGGTNSAAIWPAFWLLGDNISTVSWPTCGEIDIMEQRGSQPGTNYSTLHGPAPGGGDYNGGAGVGANYTLPNGADFYSSYHVYAVDWGPGSVTFSVDGNPFYTLTPANLPAGATWAFNGHPFYIILDVCEGGGFAPGTITSTQTMYVDYIHASSYSLSAAPRLSDQDIGSPALAGSAYFDGLTNTLNGSGSDIYNTSDQFNFASQPVTGNVTLITQVDWVSDTGQYAKGGLMLRDGSAPNASYAFIQLNPAGGGGAGAGGASFEYRSGAGSSAKTAGTDPNADLANGAIWLKLVRSGNNFAGYDSSDGITWNQIGATQTITMSQTLLGGLADDSNNNGAISTDTFSQVSILPDGFTDTNIGGSDRIGTSGYNNSNSTFTISGGGTGFAGSSDQFNLASQTATGDSVLIVDVTSQSCTNAYAMAGAMLRDNTAVNSDFAAVVDNSSVGPEFLWRTTTGITGSNVIIGVTGACWLAFIRSGNQFAAYYSLDESNWIQIGPAQTILMGSTYQAGLAVTGQNTTSLNTAVFTHVQGPSDTLNVSSGSVGIPAVSSGGIQDVSLPGLTIGSGAGVSLAKPASASNRTVLTVGGLNIAGTNSAWTGSLDLGDNDLIVRSGSVSQITSQIAQGFASAGASWTGDGINSSSAASATNQLFALGIELNSNGSGQALFGKGTSLGLFDSQSPAVTDVLVKYTYYGDTNLDGKVDGSDYSKTDNGYLNHLTGWSNGDFNYDGVVNGSDYTLIDNAFNSQGAVLNTSVASAPSKRAALAYSSGPSAALSGVWESQNARSESEERSVISLLANDSDPIANFLGISDKKFIGAHGSDKIPNPVVAQ